MKIKENPIKVNKYKQLFNYVIRAKMSFEFQINKNSNHLSKIDF